MKNGTDRFIAVLKRIVLPTIEPPHALQDGDRVAWLEFRLREAELRQGWLLRLMVVALIGLLTHHLGVDPLALLELIF